MPRLEARDLAGDLHVMPDDLPGDPCVVAMAFRQRQQADVDAWAEALAGLPFVEVPLLGTGWRMVRGWIETGMAGGTPVEVRSRVWCAYGNLKQVIAAMGGSGHRAVLLAVVRPSGEVEAIFRGRPSPGSVMAVKTAVARG